MNAPFHAQNDNRARQYVHDGIVLGEDPALADRIAEWRRQFDPLDLRQALASLRPVNGGGL